jgi:uncharacterized protein (TIGR03000 family)
VQKSAGADSDDAPLEPPVAPTDTDLDAAARSSSSNTQFTGLSASQTAQIVLRVSESARVTINDKATKSTGTERLYVVHLKPGLRYRFRIEVTDGAQAHQREIFLTAGETKTIQLAEAPLVAKR